MTPVSLVSLLQVPVPGSAQFSSPSPCPVAPMSPVSTFQLPVPGSAPFFIYYITGSIWRDPYFTGVGSANAYSWFWAFSSSYNSLHFLCQLFQCLALIFRLHLLFLHPLYCLISVHFLDVIPLFQNPVAIFLYLV